MTCPGCGMQHTEDLTVCPQCGAAMTETAAEPAAETAAAPAKSKNKLPKILLAVVGGVAAVAVLAFGALQLFASPKTKVGWAFGKTAAAYGSMANDLGFAQLSEITEKAYTEQWVLGLNVDGVQEEISLSSSVDMQARKIASALKLSGALDLSADIALYDDLLAIAMDDVGEGKYYGVSTETLGDDLAKWGADIGDVSLNFNLFDMIASVQEQEMSEEMQQATKAFFDAIIVEKGDDADKQIHNSTCSGTQYIATIPETALNAYLKAVLKEMETAVIPMNFTMNGAEMAEEDVDTITEMLGDVKIQIFVSDGYVMEVVFDIPLEDQTLTATLQLGGGENYADDLSLTISSEADGGAAIVISSTGDHTAASGTFTDEFKVSLSEGTEETLGISMKTTWKTAEAQDNLSIELTVPGEEPVTVQGNLTVEKNHVKVEMNKLTVEGQDVGVSLSYEMDGSKDVVFDESVNEAEMLFEMSDEDLQELLIDFLMENQWLLS